MKHARIAMLQMNATVGDIRGNTEKIIAGVEQARQASADIVTFPELAITGYPPQDLLLKPQFLHENRVALERICAATTGITAVVGFVDQRNDIYNAAAVLHDGRILGIQHKVYLPNYGVFDENRYFQAGVPRQIFQIGDMTFGVTICEDIWYPEGPMVIQALSGADLILNCSASPYYMGKPAHRERLTSVRASDSVVVVAYNNLVGGQDRLIFDGGSLIADQNGTILTRGKLFDEDFIVADIDLSDVERAKLSDPRHRKAVFELQLSERAMQECICAAPIADHEISRDAPLASAPAIPTDPAEEAYHALTLGLRDYVHKNGFSKAVLGLSGGIDSSVVAALAVDALGAENVLGILLPGPYSSQGSIDDAKHLAENLGMPYEIVQISPIFDAFENELGHIFEGREPDVAEENIQARIRGVVWMAVSNKFGHLPLTTGNKSEMSVGYATMYGDMSGGLAVIADVPKTTVYALADYRNRAVGYDLIPRSTIDKPPSAELRADQKDSDSLPDYQILDAILKAYIEHDKSVDDIIALGFDGDMVKDVIRKVDHSEYKRQQAAPALKVTTKAFGPDRRLPITNKYYG